MFKFFKKLFSKKKVIKGMYTLTSEGQKPVEAKSVDDALKNFFQQQRK